MVPGARMNGLFYTSPIPEVQAKLRACGCLVFDDARIDQVAGLRRAVAGPPVSRYKNGPFSAVIPRRPGRDHDNNRRTLGMR